MNAGDKRLSAADTRSVVIGHGLLVAAIFVTLTWLVPRFMVPLADKATDHLPRAFVLADDASRFVRDWVVFLVPALVLLLWLDWKLCSTMVRQRLRAPLATIWSVLLLAALTAALVWLFYALSTPGVLIYEMQHGERPTHS